MALVTFVAGDVLEAQQLNDSFAAVQFSPVSDTVATSQTTTSTSYTDLSTVGPSVTVTTGTTALILITASMGNGNNSGVDVYASFAVSGASTVAASDTNAALVAYGGGAVSGGSRAAGALVMVLTGLTAGSNTFTMKYRTSGGTATFLNRNLTVVAL